MASKRYTRTCWVLDRNISGNDINNHYRYNQQHEQVQVFHETGKDISNLTIQFPIGNHTSAEGNTSDDKSQKGNQCGLIGRIGKFNQCNQC